MNIHSSWFWFTLLFLQGGIFFLVLVIFKQNQLPMAYKIVMMLQKKLLILFLLIANWGVSQKNAESLLWKVSGKGLKEPSYVFGTFHMMCKTQFQITNPMKEVLVSCKKYYGELDMDNPEMQNKLMDLLKLKDGKTINQYMEPNDFEVFDQKYKSITGMSLMAFKQFKPFLGLSFLILKANSCNSTVQPETELMQLAKEHHLEILGLETPDQQMAILNKEPIDSQLSTMLKMVNNFDSCKQVMHEMTQLYLKKDVEALYQYMKETGVNENFESTMLISRNKKWIPKMKKAMKESPSFFAVGAGHLGGETGVIALLRKKGYQVEPINN